MLMTAFFMIFRRVPTTLACEQAPVGDSRVQSRANGMNRERSGEEEVCRGASPASHSLRSRSHDALTPTRSFAEFFSDLAGSLLAGYCFVDSTLTAYKVALLWTILCTNRRDTLTKTLTQNSSIDSHLFR